MAQYPSYLSQHVRADNFTPLLSNKLTTTATSTKVTFSPVTGAQTSTFQITNKGSYGAYLAFGKSAATATATSGSGTGSSTSYYVGKGAIFTVDLPRTSTGPVDTVAAIQGGDTQDNGSTILEISIGYGQ